MPLTLPKQISVIRSRVTALSNMESKAELREGGERNTCSKGGRVSLLIRVYNGERYLVQSIESALAQTYGNIEVIAVNDGSTDGSAEILERYSDRIRIVDTEHAGRSAAYNAGIAHMTGDWLAALDSDDIMYPDAVERLVGAAEELDSSSTTKIIPFFDLQLLGSDGRPNGRTKSYHMDNSMDAMEQGASMSCMYFGHICVSILHRSILEDVGGFDESLGRCEDKEFGMRLTVNHGYRFHHIPGIIYGYRQHDGQDQSSLRERYDTRRRMLERTVNRLSGPEQKRYAETSRRIGRRFVITTAYRRADHVLSLFAYGAHEGATARLAARMLGALLESRPAYRLVRLLTCRLRTTRIEPREGGADPVHWVKPGLSRNSVHLT